MIRPIRTFTVSPSLPPELERQRALVYNLRWAWNHDAIELFRWDRDLWEQSGHNPALMLGTIDQGTLQAAASDEGFLAHLNRVSNDFDAYLKSESTWFRKHHEGTNNLLVAYFSAEFGVTDCLSIFAGGLGILAGDHLKSASDLGVPLVAVGLLYQQGYFRQYLNEAGWQQEEYRDNDFHNLPLTLERDRDGGPLIIFALSRRPEFRRRLVFLEGYDMAVARSMTQGADVWLSTPRRPLEASGTSGMKAAANGVLNLSTLDGWWDEAWDCGSRIADRGFEQYGLSTPGLNYAFDQSAIRNPQSSIGWAIGRGEIYDDPDYQDQVEAEALYDLLEGDVIPTFYDRGEDALPRRWVERMKSSIGNLCHFFNTHRMVREYTERFYLPASERQV